MKRARSPYRMTIKEVTVANVEKDPISGTNTTGHEWDGIKELDTPLPKWWLTVFYATIIWAIGYWVVYPSWPTLNDYAKGVFETTNRIEHAKEMAAADQKYGPLFAKYAGTPISQLAADDDALKIGQRLYVNYCASCHGSDAGGGPGFPNLRDNDWLYGGDPQAIKTSILDGRIGAMPAWNAVLNEQGVDEVTAYVVSLSGRDADADKVAAGKVHYASYCAACHGADGNGNTALGAPNLTDEIWLYGGSPGVRELGIYDIP